MHHTGKNNDMHVRHVTHRLDLIVLRSTELSETLFIGRILLVLDDTMSIATTKHSMPMVTGVPLFPRRNDMTSYGTNT